jgi:hypothetical protein
VKLGGGLAAVLACTPSSDKCASPRCNFKIISYLLCTEYYSIIAYCIYFPLILVQTPPFLLLLRTGKGIIIIVARLQHLYPPWPLPSLPSRTPGTFFIFLLLFFPKRLPLHLLFLLFLFSIYISKVNQKQLVFFGVLVFALLRSASILATRRTPVPIKAAASPTLTLKPAWPQLQFPVTLRFLDLHRRD